MISVAYPDLLNLFPEHKVIGRAESAAFLIWYLESYYRLDPLEATDCVCDQPGDRGVDGIFINDADQTITIFQSKIAQNNKPIGDKAIREFAGALSQFKTPQDIEEIISSGGDGRLASLLKRTGIKDKIEDYDVRGEFVVNSETDVNGQSFLKTVNNITFIGKNTLETRYISDEREIAATSPASLDILGFAPTEYVVDNGTKVLIAPVKAKELVNLGGIGDQSIFAYNVRGPLGKTQVNKDIVRTIKDKSKHKQFPLFHNGVTVISGKLDIIDDSISIEDYYVVNGCQSLTALWENKSDLTDDLRILTKFIKLDPKSKFADEITRYSNNQNGVKARDFKSNHPVQIRIQNEFSAHYKGQYSFEIKTGEKLPDGLKITNENAGVMLIAFDLKEPWVTHRRYEVWEEKHSALFARPEVTADRIVLINAIMEEINDRLERIQNELIRKYVLTKFLLLYIVRLVLETEFPQILSHPEHYVRDESKRKSFRENINKLIDDLAIDLNFEVQNLGDDFDYRGRLRDSKWVDTTAKAVFASRVKDVGRGKVERFST